MIEVIKTNEMLDNLDKTCVHHYCIASCHFYVYGSELCAAVSAMPGFDPFRIDGQEGLESEGGLSLVHDTAAAPVFHVCLSENAFCQESHLQYTFQSDGVDSEFSSIVSGYLLQMHHDDGTHLDLWSDTATRVLYLNGDLAPQMLRFALWTGFGIMTVNYNRIPIHGSCIVNAERAYLFLGESGTGKSTHTRLWREFIAGSALLNDDSPIIAAESDGVYIYGSPWSGKTPCYKPLKFPLGGCVRLSQAPYNKMKRLITLNAYAALHPSCPPEFAYDEELYAGISQTLDAILSKVPVYHLACLPNEAAAQLSHGVMTKNIQEK